MSANYDGLTRNTWPGTWSPTGEHPIVLDAEIRGSLRTITGNAGNQLTDISGQRLEIGMLVYLINGYTANGTTFAGGNYYKYISLPGETRNAATGRLPNANANWEILVLGGGGGGGGTGYTGSAGAAGFAGSAGFTGSAGAVGFTGSAGTGSGNLTVALRNVNNVVSNAVSTINSIQFDRDAGFTVNNLGSGAVKVGFTGGTGGGGNADTFRYWEVSGQQTLVAQGSDTIRFVAGSGVTIETDNNSNPKTIYISAPRFTINLDCNGVNRPYGLDAFYDGGYPDSVFGGIVPLDAGGVT